jgi:acyl-CoA dehydrogenase
MGGGPTESPATARIPAIFKAKLSPKALEKIEQVYQWVETEIIPADPIYKAQLELPGKRWQNPPIMHALRKQAKEQGLFNLFLPNHFKESPGLTNLEYACCAEIMGRNLWAAEVCSRSHDIWANEADSLDHELPCP